VVFEHHGITMPVKNYYFVLSFLDVDVVDPYDIADGALSVKELFH